MKIALILFFSFILIAQSFGQGRMYFANVEPAAVWAEITIPQGVPASSFTGQLYGAPQTSSLDALVPLFPVTGFRPGFERFGRLQLVEVDIAFAQPEEFARFQIRVFDGPSWDSSICRGQSTPFLSLVGPVAAPGFLVGLEPFAIECIAEPPPIAIFGLSTGAVLLALLRKNGRFP